MSNLRGWGPVSYRIQPPPLVRGCLQSATVHGFGSHGPYTLLLVHVQGNFYSTVPTVVAMIFQSPGRAHIVAKQHVHACTGTLTPLPHTRPPHPHSFDALPLPTHQVLDLGGAPSQCTFDPLLVDALLDMPGLSRITLSAWGAWSPDAAINQPQIERLQDATLAGDESEARFEIILEMAAQEDGKELQY